MQYFFKVIVNSLTTSLYCIETERGRGRKECQSAPSAIPSNITSSYVVHRNIYKESEKMYVDRFEVDRGRDPFPHCTVHRVMRDIYVMGSCDILILSKMGSFCNKTFDGVITIHGRFLDVGVQ